MNSSYSDNLHSIAPSFSNEKIEAEIAFANEEYNLNPDLGKPLEEVFHSLRKDILAQYFVKEAI